MAGVAPPNVLPALEPIINAMSTEQEMKLNETTSLIVIAEACLGTTNTICAKWFTAGFFSLSQSRVSTACAKDDI